MKNKVFKIILSISIMLIGVFLITSCGHKHTYSENWEKDTTGHWHQAICNHREEKTEKENHSFDNWITIKVATETATGLESRFCFICKYEETRTIEKQENAHTYSNDWSYDSSYHWYKATCTHKELVTNKAGHTFDASDICTVCEYKRINWVLEGISSKTGNYLYLNSYNILTALISPNDKSCDVIKWKIISGSANLEIIDDVSCKIIPNTNTKENEKIEVSCSVLSSTKKITLTARAGTVRFINLDTENNGTINVLNTDSAVYITGSSVVSKQVTNLKTYSLSLSINTRINSLDIFISTASILSMDNNSVIKYSGNQKINLYLNNVILYASSCEYSALDCTSLEIFSSGFCEINGANSKASTTIGGTAIRSNNLVINAEGLLKIKGGNGFDGINATSTGFAGGNGTSGGTAIYSINVTFKKIPYNTILSITAGDGGNGGNGAQGESKSGKGTAGAGGNGGNGADSGYCIQSSEVTFEMNSIQSTILFVSGKGGNGGNGGNGGMGDQAFLSQPSNGGRGGNGGNGGTSKTPFNNDVVLTGGKFSEFQRVIINDLGFGGSGGNGGNGGDVDKDNINPATGGTGGDGGNGGQIEELYIQIQNEKKFSLSHFSSVLKKESSEKGLGGVAGGTTGNHQGSFNYGNKGYDGKNGERAQIIIDINLFNYIINEDRISYSITGMNTELSSNIIIPSTYRNLPITSIKGIDYNEILTNVFYEGTIEDWCKIDLCAPAAALGEGFNLNPMENASHFFLRNSNNEWEEVTSIEIPEGVTKIGGYQFYGFNNVTSITIPNSVKYLDRFAFAECDNLSILNFSNDLEYIDYGVFKGCSKLRYNEFQNGAYLSINDNQYAILMSILDNTVYNFEFHQDTKIISSAAFANAINLEQVVIPNKITLIGVDAFLNCKSLKKIVLPQSLIVIASGAFINCSNLTSLIIPSSVKIIEDDAFVRCYRLVEIYNLSSVDILHSDIQIDENIENFVKIVHTSLEEESILIEKDDHVFYKDLADKYYLVGGYQGKETNLILPYDIEGHTYEIGEYAFYNCSNLTSVIVPNSVTSIGYRAFYHCINLENVFYEGTSAKWNVIRIDSNNSCLTSATRYYYSATQPTTSGNYWHYVDDVVTIW